MKISHRVQAIEPFRVVEVLTRAKALEAAGHDIVQMGAGEPDFVTARPIIDAAKQALESGATYYSQAQGLPQLKAAIAQYYAADYGVAIDPQRILVTPGASGALQLIAALLIDAGDGVLMTDPGYPCNRNFIRLMGGEEQLVSVDAQDNYQMTERKARQAWRHNTCAMLLATPSNPTGTQLALAEMKKLLRLCEDKSAHLIVDEIYQGLVFDSAPTSVLSLSDDVFVVNSFSKYFGMTGWRLGWMVVPEWAVEPLNRLAQNLFISMSTMSQFAALAAFIPQTRAILEERKQIFKQRRDFLCQALQGMGLTIPCLPTGAFYVYLPVDQFTQDSQSFCIDVLDRLGVAMTPGADFGTYHANTHIRLAYTTSMEQLEKGVERLRSVFSQ